MNQIIEKRFIPQQLTYFIAGQRCCQQYAWAFRDFEHNSFAICAAEFGLHSRSILYNGSTRLIKVYKRKCKHFLEESPSLNLSFSTLMELYSLLKNSDFACSLITENINEQRKCYIIIEHISLPLISLSPTTATAKKKRSLNKFGGHIYTQDIANSLNTNRLLVLGAELRWDKSLLVPMAIFEDYVDKRLNVFIICIEHEQVLVTYNSARLATIFGEKLGETVGIQLPHKTITSSASRIIYTTARHFLRFLIGTESKFSCITHVIVNDIQLHDPYIDITLRELRQAIILNENLKVVLLSQVANPKKFINYFEEGIDMCLENQPRCEATPRIMYLEEIYSNFSVVNITRSPQHVYKNHPLMYRNKSSRHIEMDKCLTAYEELGTNAALRPFLYAVNYELIPINYQHSVNGKTAITIASKLRNAHHLRLLLFLGADPYISDSQLQNAITLAAIQNNDECIDVLNNFCLNGYGVKNAKPEFVNYDLIIDILNILCIKKEYAPGNILIILPTYHHLVKLNYMILSHYLVGSLQEISIYLLHSKMKNDYLNFLQSASETNTKMIVLATDIVEYIPLSLPFKYLIDTACERTSVYDSLNCCTGNIYEWVTKDCLLRRLLLLDPKATDAQCFRLIPKEVYHQINETKNPSLQTMELDMICLIVKLLSQNTLISEYLSYTIAPPPMINVHHAVQHLKKIEILSESEAVTWLGCRVLDMPVSCQLGRTLVFGILLQCLDPILTIASSLLTSDVLSLPFSNDIDKLWGPLTMHIQNNIKKERARLAENQFSDHLVLLHLYMEWRNRPTSKRRTLHLTNEYEFILNGHMEELCSIRAGIVCSLRGLHLIHNSGYLNIKNLNTNSKSWAIVKAALTGGMYPNICAVDMKNKCLKSAHSTNIYLHPNTVLHDFLEPFSAWSEKLPTPWLIYTKHKNHLMCNTAVTPLAVAIFAGSSKLRYTQTHGHQIPSNDPNVNIFIDEWICLTMPKTVVELIMNTRKVIFQMYYDLLRYCKDFDKWANKISRTAQYTLVQSSLKNMFEIEENVAGFKRVSNIMYGPFNNTSDLFLLPINSHFTWNTVKDAISIVSPNQDFVEKHYFILYTKQPAMCFFDQPDQTYENNLAKFVRHLESPKRYVFVILYGKNPDIMYSVSRARTIEGKFVLKEYFRNAIPLSEIKEACASLCISLPRFDERLVSCLIDQQVGNIIMDLFAFRNYWIHKK